MITSTWSAFRRTPAGLRRPILARRGARPAGRLLPRGPGSGRGRRVRACWQFVQFLVAAGALAALTMVPGPDMAVVTKRAVASGCRDGLRTAGGITTWLLISGC